jgi:hypothetical protein
MRTAEPHQRLDQNYAGYISGERNKNRAGNLTEKCLLRTPSGMISTRCQDLAAPCLLGVAACACLCFALVLALWQIKETHARSRICQRQLREKESCVLVCICICVGERNSIVCHGADSHGNEGFCMKVSQCRLHLDV